MSFLHDGFIARLLYVLESYAGKVTLQFDRLDLPPPAGWQGKMQKLAGAALTACSRAEQGPLQHLESCRTFATRYTQPYFLLLDKPIWYLITVLPYDNLCRAVPCHSAVLPSRRDETSLLRRFPVLLFSVHPLRFSLSTSTRLVPIISYIKCPKPSIASRLWPPCVTNFRAPRSHHTVHQAHELKLIKKRDKLPSEAQTSSVQEQPFPTERTYRFPSFYVHLISCCSILRYRPLASP